MADLQSLSGAVRAPEAGADHDRALRAALTGIYTEAMFGPNFAGSVPAPLRPIPAGESIERITQSKSPFQRTAWFITARKLALGAGGVGAPARPYLIPYLKACVGDQRAAEILEVANGHESRFQFMKQVDNILGKPVLITPPPTPPVVEVPDAARFVAAPLVSPPPSGSFPPPNPPGTTFPTPVTTVLSTPALNNACGTGSFDASSLVTTATACGTSTLSYALLAQSMDPRSWSRSVFWLQSYKAILVKGVFQRDSTPKQPLLGTSWKGLLFEYVEWALNDAVVSSFQNYLNIDFNVGQAAPSITLRFSLYACQGSMLLERIAGGGIDVDSGFATATLDASRPDTFDLRARKHLRFTDTVSRSTPNQGPPGAGQTLNYMSPAIVSTWMDAAVEQSS